ncbi:MAG: Omp28 family outer membrane lipoprotein [Bacteroidetes bacterium]|nr:Omp28 family outer membrane lipoprotein [Bacteroidota bacterium]
MKNAFFLFAIFVFTMFACKEIPPEINIIVSQGDCTGASPSSVADQKRQVLVEEFTGVRCVNCPAGSQAIEDLIGLYGEQLIPVSIHAGDFSFPYDESLYNFQTTQGTQILSYVGEPFGYPTAVVNRKLFEGEFDLQLGQSQWADFVAQELAIPPRVKIAIEKQYDTASRELTVEVTLFFEEDLSDEDVRLSLMLVENDIEDYQVTPDGIQADYKHKHVLRTMLTNYDGNPLTEDLTVDAQVCKKYIATLIDSWVPENCHVIAFVNLGGETKDVLQAVEVKVID